MPCCNRLPVGEPAAFAHLCGDPVEIKVRMHKAE